MYRCEDCGKVYDFLEMAKFSEEYLSLDGRSFKIGDRYICDCNGELEEVKKCKLCDKKYIPVYDDFCQECSTIEKAKDFGDLNQKQINLNGFLAYMFDENEIEEILMKTLQENKKFIENHTGKTNCYEYECSDYLSRNL